MTREEELALLAPLGSPTERPVIDYSKWMPPPLAEAVVPQPSAPPAWQTLGSQVLGALSQLAQGQQEAAAPVPPPIPVGMGRGLSAEYIQNVANQRAETQRMNAQLANQRQLQREQIVAQRQLQIEDMKQQKELLKERIGAEREMMKLGINADDRRAVMNHEMEFEAAVKKAELEQKFAETAREDEQAHELQKVGAEGEQRMKEIGATTAGQLRVAGAYGANQRAAEAQRFKNEKALEAFKADRRKAYYESDPIGQLELKAMVADVAYKEAQANAKDDSDLKILEIVSRMSQNGVSPEAQRQLILATVPDSAYARALKAEEAAIAKDINTMFEQSTGKTAKEVIGRDLTEEDHVMPNGLVWRPLGVDEDGRHPYTIVYDPTGPTKTQGGVGSYLGAAAKTLGGDLYQTIKGTPYLLSDKGLMDSLGYYRKELELLAGNAKAAGMRELKASGVDLNRKRRK